VAGSKATVVRTVIMAILRLYYEHNTCSAIHLRVFAGELRLGERVRVVSPKHALATFPRQLVEALGLARSPCAYSVWARLFIEERVSGWSVPSTRSAL
jgi:hypothetical protein